MSERGQWGSRIGFVLAAMGSAIGLGNIWRFPYIAFENGGGAFLIPYFTSLFVVGIPIMILEFGLGHKMKSAFPRALYKINPKYSWIGWWSVSFVMFGIVIYYAVVIAWCLNYFVYSFTLGGGQWIQDASGFFFGTFLKIPEHFYSESQGFILGDMRYNIIAALFVIWVLNWVITFFGIEKGIERANKIIIPLLIFLTIVLVIWSLTFEGAFDGIDKYLKPDWKKVLDPAVWIAAFSQIFFTLSLGFGIMVAYASYLPDKVDIPKYAVITSVGNCLFSFVVGFSVFATIGFIAAQQQVTIDQLKNLSGPGLVFVTFPTAIAKMGGGGSLFGAVFFFSLVIAGLSSSISIVEAFVSAVQDRFNVERKVLTSILCTAAFFGGIIFCTGSGLYILDIVDHFFNTYGLVLVAVFEALIVGWIVTTRELCNHLDSMRDPRQKSEIDFFMKFIISALLALIWFGLVKAELHNVGARFLLLGTILIVWLDDHWLNLDIKIIIPALLIYLVDMALVKDITPTTPDGMGYYGGYPINAIWVGVIWIIMTLLIAVTLDFFSRRSAKEI